MQYDHYRDKVKRFAGILGKMYAHMTLIIIALVALTLAVTALVATKGLLVAESDCPSEVVYGEKLDFKASFMTAVTRYEYRASGSSTWSEEKPVFPGDYQVRAYGKTASGTRTYTKIYDFTIVPRELVLEIRDKTVEYGEMPRVTAKLAKGDILSCEAAFSDWGTTSTTAYADLSTLRITDKKGNDRLPGYTVSDVTYTPVTVKPRSLTVTVQDASKVYDDTALSFDGYEISKGTLLAGDNLVALFRDTLVDAGTKTNTPTLHIYNAEGRNVTGMYNITVKSGKLTVEKRSLIIRTESASYVYSGYAAEHYGYTLDPSTPLVAGHYLKVKSAASLLDCGSVENALTFDVRNRSGGDESHNYSLFVEAGTLTVTPREVIVHTQSGVLVYDGTEQTYPYVTVENGVGDEYRVTKATSLRDVGSATNHLTVEFYRGDKNITSNYIIRGYTFGEITVERRPIHVVMADDSKIYDGTPLKAGRFTEVSSGTGYGLAKGHSLSLKAEGSVLFGTAENRYVEGSARILDAEKKDVTHNYLITAEDGTLTVKPRPLTVSSPNESKVYDGRPLSANSWEIVSGSLLPGHQLNAALTGATITDVGAVDNGFRQDLTRVVDTATGQDVTKYYEINYAVGILEIMPRPITVQTFSGEWMYDGMTHSGTQQLLLAEGTLAAGQYLVNQSSEPTVITNAGTRENRQEAGVLSSTGDQTHNYCITYRYGTLTVTKRPITVRVKSLTVTYDGKPHTSVELELSADSPYSLVRGHILKVQTPDQLFFTEAGSYINDPFISVYDPEAAYFVTPNYEITRYDGTVTVEKRSLHFRINGEKIYDGQPLDTWHFEYLNGTSPAPGHTLNARPDVSLPTHVISLTADVDRTKLSVTDQSGADVIKNYDVKCFAGTLTVKPRPISVQTASAEKIYDGTPLTAYTVSLTPDSLPMVEGDQVGMVVNGKQTAVGQSTNTCYPHTFGVRNKFGYDVTSNYVLVSVTEGTLTVKYDATLTVTTGSASKTYDGLPLYCEEYNVEITRGQLPAGFTVWAETTGLITRPGSAANTASVTVLDGEGKDVTPLFDVQLRLGVLTVTEDPQGSTAFGRVYSDKNGRVYLRMTSYGSYNGKGWDPAVPYSGSLSNGHSLNYLPSAVIQYLNLTSSGTLTFSDMRVFMLPYYMTMSNQNPKVDSDTDYTGMTSASYSATYYPIENTLALLEGFHQVPPFLQNFLLGSHKNAENAYRSFVHSQYLAIDSETLAFMKEIIAREGLNASSASVIGDVAAYIRNAARYDTGYDIALDGEENVAVAFLRDYKEGVCVHYATAATLLYRALGIPARYTTGFMLDVKAGEWVEIRSPGHAWVEVYVDGLGWVQVEVTGSAGANPDPDPDPPVEQKPELELIPAFRHKVYDGTYLYAADELVLTPSLEALLQLGYTYTVTVSGTQREVGDGVSVVHSFTLYDPRGRDVTADFRIVKRNGLLRVTAAAVEVFLYPVVKTYDGKPAVWSEGDYAVLSLPEGCRLELTVTLPADTIGLCLLTELNRSADSCASYRIYRDGLDVTRSYSLVFAVPEGTEDVPVLTVNPRTLELTAASETRIEGEKPLANSTVYVSKGTLAPGHVLEARAVGEQAGVGSSPNRVDTSSLRILDAQGQDVTAYYRILTVDGILTVTEDSSANA